MFQFQGKNRLSILLVEKLVIIRRHAGVPEWSKGPDLRSGGEAFVGSNPTPGTYSSSEFSLFSLDENLSTNSL